MAKYAVTITEVNVHPPVLIEACDEEEAKEKALESYDDGDIPILGSPDISTEVVPDDGKGNSFIIE